MTSRLLEFNVMTQHELLVFVTGLHDHIERSVSSPGPWCWPTRELLVENLSANKHLWGPHWGNEFNDTLKTLKRKHWVSEGGCQSHCHALHVQVTAAGAEALRLMDEFGCEGHIHVKRRTRCHDKFHFHRKLAA